MYCPVESGQYCVFCDVFQRNHLGVAVVQRFAEVKPLVCAYGDANEWYTVVGGLLKAQQPAVRHESTDVGVRCKMERLMQCALTAAISSSIHRNGSGRIHQYLLVLTPE